MNAGGRLKLASTKPGAAPNTPPPKHFTRDV
jgi:hypothetical protein